MEATHPGILAVVPLKALDAAKSRLSPVLDDERRKDLVALLFDIALDACTEASSLSGTIVVAGDPAGLVLARRRGALPLLEREPGLQGALDLADEQLERMRAEASIIVMGDLPGLRGDDLDAVCAAAPPGPCVVVLPAADGGTAVLFRRPATVVRTQFGPGSAQAHHAAAESAGVPVVVLAPSPPIEDLDTPAQLEALVAARALEWVPE